MNKDAFENATRIYNDNEPVDTYNMERLITLYKPITQITCENSNLKGSLEKLRILVVLQIIFIYLLVVSLSGHNFN